MPAQDAHVADNRATWDDRAAVHEASGYGIDELIADPDRITPEVAQDVDRLGDLRGRDVVHLQCHLGTDTVALKRLGARRVVGVDLSGESIRRARSIAERAGAADIELVEADVYDARAAVDGSFDVVCTSIGVLCWLTDVAGWAGVVASLLRPGGRFVVRDDHPVLQTLGDDTSRGLVIEQPYFERAEPSTWDEPVTYIEASPEAPRITHGINHQWNHSIGEIVTAVLDAGLVLDSFEETPCSAWMRYPDLMEPHGPGYRLREGWDRVPMQFVLAAHRPA